MDASTKLQYLSLEYDFIEMQSLAQEPELDTGNKRQENSVSPDKMEEL